LWARQLGGAVFERPAVLERTLVVTATDGSVAALDARRGDVLWGTQLGRSVYYTPARCTPLLVPGRVVVVAPGDPQRGGVGVFALDAATGGVAWQTADGAGLSSPCLLPAGACPGGACPGGAFALATPRGEVLALSLAGGGRLWTLATGHAMYDAAPVMAGPLCVTPALDGTVFALDPATGALAWAYRVGAGFVLASPGGAAGSGGSGAGGAGGGDVVIATMGGTVVMLRPAAGAR
jgi:outer membrane protein assembly factor BamB